MNEVHRTNHLIRSAVAGVAVALAPGAMVVAGIHNVYIGGATGNWGAAANWNQRYVPGSNAGSSAQDDVYLDNDAASGGYVVTVNTNLSSDNNWRSIQIGDGFYSSQYAVTVDVNSGGVLASQNNSGINVGGNGRTGANGNAILNIDGGRMNTLTQSINVAGVVGGSTATVNVSSTTPSSAGYLEVDQLSVGSNGTVNLSDPYGAGTAIMDIGHGIALSGNAQINQSGGTFTTQGGGNYIGNGGTGTAVYSISGGLWNAAGANPPRYTNVGMRSAGTLDLTGGTANFNYLSVANVNATVAAVGLFEISGGSTTARALVIGNSGGLGTGSVTVVGSGATGITASGGYGSTLLTEYANGTLNFLIDRQGVTTINTTNSNDAITLAGKLTLGFLPGVNGVDGTVYNLVSSTSSSGINITGLAGWNTADWSVGLTTSGPDHILQATYIGPVPEPGALTLLAIGGGAILLLPRIRIGKSRPGLAVRLALRDDRAAMRL
jgi:hypothetical protein